MLTMAKVLKTIIVNSKLHLSVCGRLIKRPDKIHIYPFTVCIVICRKTMLLRYRKEKTALHSTKKKTK
jgi:hypothetical protein